MVAAKATEFTIGRDGDVFLFALSSEDGMNRLTSTLVHTLAEEIQQFGTTPDDLPALPLILSGFTNFSVGADLNEIAGLTASAAFEFARAGQRLMKTISDYPATVFAAVEGHCMGGGLDLALACHRRVCASNASFGHRGAALGIMTGWGGTQRLSRLVGKGRAMQMFVAAEKMNAQQALAAGLVEAVVEDPVTYITDMLRAGL